jgi:hypothetical protein
VRSIVHDTDVREWVNRVALTVHRTLPVFPHEQTSATPVGMSQGCQQATLEMKEAAN